MAQIVLLLLVFLILTTKSVHCYGGDYGGDLETYLSVIVILSVINLLTIVIICILGLLLYKERSFKRKIEFSPPPNNIKRNEYIRQDSDIHSPGSYRAQMTRNESVISILSENDNTENIVQVEIPSDTVYKRENKSEQVKDLPLPQKPKVEPIIRREQMDALVKDILSKTKRKDTDSLSDLNKLITEGQNTNNENNINEAPTHANNTTQNESGLEDQYDRLPTPVPLQDAADSEDDDLYDVIPNNKKINTFNCIVSDNGYLMPISSDNKCTSSNDYVNARKSPSTSNANVSTNSKMNDIKDLRSSTGKESSQAGKEKDKESAC